MTTERLLDQRTLELLWRAAQTPHDPNVLDRDEELIERLSPQVDLLMRLYFRLEITGLEAVPAGPALLVMNHEAGITYAQLLGMGARWILRRGLEDPVVGLMHDAMFEVPLLGNLLASFGAVAASHDNGEAAFATGQKVMVTPGGNLEAFRRWPERYRIKFGGRTGWARLALRAGVPVVPAVSIGGHETFVVLCDGQSLVRRLGLKRFGRIDTFPLFLGLPWGVGVGPLFHLPLPSKSVIRFLAPIDTAAFGDADDPGAVLSLYDEVTAAMQLAMNEMALKRRVPVLG